MLRSAACSAARLCPRRPAAAAAPAALRQLSTSAAAASPLKGNYGLWIDGQEVPSESGALIPIENPLDGSILTHVAGATEKDVENAVSVATEVRFIYQNMMEFVLKLMDFELQNDDDCGGVCRRPLVRHAAGGAGARDEQDRGTAMRADPGDGGDRVRFR